MKSILILAAFACLICLKSASALPDFISSQSCDSFVCPNWGDLWNSFGAFFNKVFESTPQPAIPDIPTTPDANENPPTTSPPVTDTKTDIEIDSTAPPIGPHGCDLPLSAPDSQGSPGDTNLRQCEVATAQLIWPVSCEDTAQNTNTEQILSGMDSGYLTSKDPLCPLSGGIFYWIANLTPQQIDSLRQQTKTVRAVTPNGPYVLSDLKRPSRWTKGTEVPTIGNKNRLNKRDILTVARETFLTGSDPSLTFLSTPLNQRNTDKTYAYFSQAGSGVRAYIIDTGLEVPNNDLAPEMLEWIYALDVPRRQSDEDRDGHGTCLASKVAGSLFGVAKKPRLIIVKTSPRIGSFLDAVARVIVDIRAQPNNGRGQTVIHIGGAWEPLDVETDPVSEAIETLIRVLSALLQAVVVTHASNTQPNEDAFGDITMWPAALSLKMDIITVGAVQTLDGEDYGKRFPWSLGGDALSVSAPGNGYCSDLDGLADAREGPSLASAIVTGLVVYFLSIPDLNRYFQAQASLPGAVRDYVKGMSYRRYQAQYSVWNGLDSRDPIIAFPQWWGIPTL